MSISSGGNNSSLNPISFNFKFDATRTLQTNKINCSDHDMKEIII